MKDLKLIGYDIQDELLEFSMMMDESYDPVAGKMAYLDCEPGLHTVEFWSGPGKTGNQYPTQIAGSNPDTGKILILDPSKGLCWAGDTVPDIVYVSYFGFGSPVRSLEMAQAYECRSLTFPLIGSMADNTVYVQRITFPVPVLITDAIFSFQNASGSGASIWYIQDDLAGTHKITLTIPQGNNQSDPPPGTLKTKQIVIKSGTASGVANGWVWIRLGIAKGK